MNAKNENNLEFKQKFNEQVLKVQEFFLAKTSWLFPELQYIQFLHISAVFECMRKQKLNFRPLNLWN